MRLARALASLTLLLLTGSAPAQQGAGARFPLYVDSWAVIIGVNDYQHRRVPKLRYAVNDARAIEQTLLAQGFRRDRIVTLIDGQATKAAIERLLGDQLRAQMSANDRLLVFFAGHGKTDTLRSGEEEGYLLPVDGDPGALFSTAISMTALRQISDRLPAKHILYVVDACYSGYALFNRAIADELLEEMVKKPAIQILTAGRQQDQAQERGGHGVFTEVLVRALQGDAFAGKDWLALEELGLWVKQRVFAESNKKQLPQYGNLSGEGQFVFLKPGGPVAKAPSTVEPAKPAVRPYRHDGWAVVIGVGSYQHAGIPSLRYPVADAEAMYETLVGQAGFKKERVLLLTGKTERKPTLRNIKWALGTFLARSAKKDDTVLIFFAGHGALEIDLRGVEKDGLAKYLVPADAERDDLYSTALPMDEIQTIFDRIEAERVVVFLDTCYSGAAGGRTFASKRTRAASLDELFLDRLTRQKGRVIVTAARPSEVCVELPELGHGLFTYHLLEGLKGGADLNRDGIVSLQELFQHVEEQVSRKARAVGVSQRPMLKGQLEGALPLVKLGSQ
ncbi:MAG: caspase family protein [Candidatus Rokubacteria bacterium]|nr:caspase family protein [Candidatus Rokubacteria bacterium]